MQNLQGGISVRSSSLKMIDAGIANPREYRDELINEWYVRSDYLTHVQIYIVREAIPADVFFRIKDGELTIQNKQYSVTWINPPSACREAKNLLISLRFCKYLGHGFALIKILRGEAEYERLQF